MIYQAFAHVSIRKIQVVFLSLNERGVPANAVSKNHRGRQGKFRSSFPLKFGVPKIFHNNDKKGRLLN